MFQPDDTPVTGDIDVVRRLLQAEVDRMFALAEHLEAERAACAKVHRNHSQKAKQVGDASATLRRAAYALDEVVKRRV